MDKDSVATRVLTSGQRLKKSISSLKSMEIREIVAARRIQQVYRKYLVTKALRPASSKKLKMTNDTLALTTAFFTSTMVSAKPMHAREMALYSVLEENAVQSIDTKPQPAIMSAAMKEILALRGSPYTIEVVDMDCLVHDQFVNMMCEKWLLCSTEERMSIHLPSKDEYIPFYANFIGCDLRPWFSDMIFVAKGGPNREHVRKVMTGPSSKKHFEGVLSAIKSLNESMEWSKDMHQLTAKVKKIFWTMRSEMMMPMVRSIGYILCKGWRLLFEGLYIDMASIERIKKLVDEINEDVSLVFTPTHKSHLDYLIVSFVCFAYGLPLPRIAAGNNLNLPLVGSYLRSNGSFFIRRSFQGDTLYKETLTAYVHELLEDSAPIEVFVEGGRSRHGRVMKPRFGFFNMIAAYLEKKPKKDVLIVPISIDYDKVLEVPDYVAQLLGQPKQKESIFNLIKSIFSLFFNRGGFCYVRFGDSIPMQPSLQSMDQLAKNVSLEMQACGTITSTCLVSAILLWHRNSVGYTMKDLHGDAQWLIQILTARNATVAPFSSIEMLVDHALHILNHPTTLLPLTCSADQILSMAYYRNHLMHHFLPDMCITTVLSSPFYQSKQKFTVDNVVEDMQLIWKFAQRLCPTGINDLKTVVESFLCSFPALVRKDAMANYTIETTAWRVDRFVGFTRMLLWPFMDALQLVMHVLKQHVAPLNEKHRQKHHQFSERQVIHWVHSLIQSDLIEHQEAFSMESIKQALAALIDYGVLMHQQNDRVYEMMPKYTTLAAFEELNQLIQGLRKPRRKLWQSHASSVAHSSLPWNLTAMLL